MITEAVIIGVSIIIGAFVVASVIIGTFGLHVLRCEAGMVTRSDPEQKKE